MPRYKVTLTNEEKMELEQLIQKGGKGYQIKHAQILLKLNEIEDNADWTYARIKDAYHTCSATIANIAKMFVTEGLEAALGRKVQTNRYRKITGEVEAQMCVIACSTPPEGYCRWTMQMIADELVRLKVVDSISDSTVCETLKKRNKAMARRRMVHSESGR